MSGKKYSFETNQFGLSEDGIHLLRSRYNYETIGYLELDTIVISKGHQISNWLIALLIGLILLIGSLYTYYKLLYAYLILDNNLHFYYEQFLLPILPIILGTFSVYYALKRDFVLIYTFGDKSKSLPLEQINKEGQIKNLICFFKENDILKHKFELKAQEK